MLKTMTTREARDLICDTIILAHTSPATRGQWFTAEELAAMCGDGMTAARVASLISTEREGLVYTVDRYDSRNRSVPRTSRDYPGMVAAGFRNVTEYAPSRAQLCIMVNVYRTMTHNLAAEAAKA